jgi:peptidoglycan/xylan/chitin deacetylase (PgdA/CDA1 family)
MHEFNLKMIKIMLVVVVAAAVVIMVDSISILKGNYYWRRPFFVMQWDYLKTEKAFIDYNYGGITNWLKASKSVPAPGSTQAKKANSIPILLYHGVINNPKWQPDGVSIDLDDFRQQMFLLKKSGYQTIKMEDYLAFTKGEKELPEKSFILTFDDGRKDSYYPVDPILRVLGYTAVMNIITGRSLGADNAKSVFHLSQMELEKMIESGRWQIESHGRDDHNYEKTGPNGEKGHFLSNKLWLDSKNRLETEDEYKKRVYDDLVRSKADIEKKLGTKVLGFAYPFGDFGQAFENFPQSQEILTSIVRLIYPITFYQAGNSDFPTNYKEEAFLTKRIGVDSSLGPKDLLNLLNNNQEKTIGYTDDFSQDNGWLKGWGSFNISGNSITISDSQSEDSALTFLGGTYLWQDYYVQAKTRLFKGNAFALTARYYDENNFVSCDFSDDHVALAQRVKKADLLDTETLLETNLNSGREAIVGISVKQGMGSCFLDGKKVVTGPIDNSLKHGGISFKIWDPNPAQKGSALTIRDLRTSALPPALP